MTWSEFGLLITSFGGIVGAIQAYRAGIAKNKSLQSETIKNIHELISSDLEWYKSLFDECEKDKLIIANERDKWKEGFKILRAEQRNRTPTNLSSISYAKVQELTLPALKDIRDSISNHS